MSAAAGLDPGPWTLGQLLVAAEAAREKQIELARLVWIAGLTPAQLPTRVTPNATDDNRYSGQHAAKIIERTFFPLLKRNKRDG